MNFTKKHPRINVTLDIGNSGTADVLFEKPDNKEIDLLMTSYNMAAAGLGICFVTDTLVKEVAPNDNLLFYKINSPHSKRTVFLLHKKRDISTR